MRKAVGMIVCIAWCVAVSSARGQVASRSADTVKKQIITPVDHNVKPKGPRPIKHEMSAGIRLNSNGWSVYTDFGKVKPKDLRRSDMFYNVRFWQIEFTEKKDPKEEKLTSSNNTGNGSNRYIYGKINNFYALKLGYGFRKLLVGKPDPGSVSMHWVNVIGVSIGLEKPYYLNIYSDPNAIKYSDATATEFLNQDLIEGSAGFGKGLSEIKVIPGGHFKSAIHFDFSANRKNVLGVETGFNVEYYSSDIQMLANKPGTTYFFDIFLAIQFGRRW